MPTSPNLGFTYPTPLDPSTADVWGATLNVIFLALDSELATRTIAQSYAELGLSNARLIDNAETVNALGNISGDVVIDYTNGHYQWGTVTGNITSLTINNWTATGAAAYMTLELIQDGTGSRTLTLGSAYRTEGGIAITLSTTAGAIDKLRLETRDSGSNIDVFANLGLA